MTTATDYSTWVPAKEEYTDDEIRSTPLYERLKASCAVPGPGGKTIVLPDEAILPIAHNTIKEMWANLNRSRFSDDILHVFERLDEAKIDHGNEVIIRRSDDGQVGTYKPTKGAGRKRFSHDGYAKLIGFGEDTSSETWKQAIERITKSGHKKLHGGFVLLKSQMKNPAKNGVFELLIEKGDTENKLCSSFTARLFQYPDNGAKVSVVQFPPKSGSKDTLVINDEVTEVASMSQMMKQSILQGAQTPAVMFGLIEKLKLLGEDTSDLEAEGEEEEDEAPAPVAKQPQPQQKKGGKASTLLNE